MNVSIRYAVVHKLIPSNPAEGINFPKTVIKLVAIEGVVWILKKLHLMNKSVLLICLFFN